MQTDPSVPDYSDHSVPSHSTDVLWKILNSRDQALSLSRHHADSLQAELTYTKATLQKAWDQIHQVEAARQQDQFQTESFRLAAEERLALINELNQVASERLVQVNDLDRAATERLALIHQLQGQLQQAQQSAQENGQLRQQIQQLEEKLQQQTQQFQQIEQRADQLQQRVDRQQQTVTRLRQKTTAFRDQIRQLEQDIALLSTGKGALKTLQRAIVRKIGLSKIVAP